MCEELRKRKVDVCCMQEVTWKDQGSRFCGLWDEGCYFLTTICGGQEMMQDFEGLEFW